MNHQKGVTFDLFTLTMPTVNTMIYAGIWEFITEIMDEFYNSNSSKPIEISSTTNISDLYDAIFNSNDVTITKLI